MNPKKGLLWSLLVDPNTAKLKSQNLGQKLSKAPGIGVLMWALIIRVGLHLRRVSGLRYPSLPGCLKVSEIPELVRVLALGF